MNLYKFVLVLYWLKIIFEYLFGGVYLGKGRIMVYKWRYWYLKNLVFYNLYFFLLMFDMNVLYFVDVINFVLM